MPRAAQRILLASTLVTASSLLGCGEPPAPPGAPSGPSAAPAASAAPSARAAGAASTAPSGSAAPTAAPSPDESAPAPAAAPPVDLAQSPRLIGDDGAPLPQTDDRPSASSPAFRRRMELLFEAIQKGDPDVATEAVFFPRVAYAQVKDIPKPEADWKSRLVRAFERDVRKYHDRLGDRPEACRLLGVDVDEKRVKVMERGKEGNKLPYHRVTRSRIRYADPDGVERSLELTSLIAWRGEWFVVHLHGFR